MPKCDFNKVPTEVTLWYGCSLVNLMNIFRTPFSRNASGGCFYLLHILLHHFYSNTSVKTFPQDFESELDV